MMSTRWRAWPRISAVALVAAVALVGCGDDGGSAPVGDGGSVEVESGGDGSGSASVPSIDPGAMPAPAEAELEVDGEVIVYRPPDPEDERLFTCDLGTDRITVNIQTPDGHDLLVQVSTLDTGEWAGSVVAKSRDSDRTYQGSGPYGTGAFAVEGQYMVFVGPFGYYTSDDPLDVTDVGEVRLAVTCP